MVYDGPDDSGTGTNYCDTTVPTIIQVSSDWSAVSYSASDWFISSSPVTPPSTLSIPALTTRIASRATGRKSQVSQSKMIKVGLKC